MNECADKNAWNLHIHFLKKESSSASKFSNSRSMQFSVESQMLCSSLFQSYIKMTEKNKNKGFCSFYQPQHKLVFLFSQRKRDSCRSSLSLNSIFLWSSCLSYPSHRKPQFRNSQLYSLNIIILLWKTRTDLCCYYHYICY